MYYVIGMKVDSGQEGIPFVDRTYSEVYRRDGFATIEEADADCVRLWDEGILGDDDNAQICDPDLRPVDSRK